VLHSRPQEPPVMLHIPVKYVVDKAVAGFQAIDGAYLKLLGKDAGKSASKNA